MNSGIRDNHYCGRVGDFLKPHLRDGSRVSVVSAYTTDFELVTWLVIQKP